MKKAFTMIELIFILVVIGILTAMALPRLKESSLAEAATQVASHIRYTQHLAMQDDKYDPTNANWYQERWTIRFFKKLTFTNPPASVHNDIWAYTIYSDLPNYAGHNPDLNGMARNPQNPSQYLSGGYNNTLWVDDQGAMKELQLGTKYGIKNIAFSGGCRSNVRYIHFDYMGRPLNSFPTNAPYEIPAVGWHTLLTSRCIISLCTTNPCPDTNDYKERIDIAIEPESGYTHILPQA